MVDVLLEVFAHEQADELSSILQEMMDMVMKEATHDGESLYVLYYILLFVSC